MTIETQGTISNRDGLGTLLTLIADQGGPAQTRQIIGGSNYLSQSELLAPFGVGNRSEPLHRLTVQWPSGIQQDFFDIPVNSRLLLVEPIPEPGACALVVVAVVLLPGPGSQFLRGRTRCDWQKCRTPMVNLAKVKT